MPGNDKIAFGGITIREIQPAFTPNVFDVVVSTRNRFCAAVWSTGRCNKDPLLVFVVFVLRHDFGLSFRPVLEL